jgi:hypothetical protein
MHSKFYFLCPFKNCRKRFFILHAVIFLFFNFSSLQAQQFGGNAPSLKWKQINTDTVRVVFPAGMDMQARRVADIVHHLSRTTAGSVGNTNRKISIVLQNQTTLSNAYVGLAPWRSEFYLTTPQNSLELGSLPWYDNLAIHEWRHVQQYSNYRKGLSKIASWVFGQEGQAVANNAAVPDWFFEGDAVFNETAVSGQGRGRLPDFFNGYRSLWKADKSYSYMKLRNGSLRHYVPDHYQLGYLVVAYGREKYGHEFWKKVTAEAAAYRSLFYPFQAAVKKYSGKTFKNFINDAIIYYKDEMKTVTESDSTAVTTAEKNYAKDYTFPYLLGEDSVLALKKTYRDIPAWHIINGEKETKLAVKDIGPDDYYTYCKGKIVYTAYEPDARWGWKDYSVIRILDINTKLSRAITKRSKYFSPDLSRDGARIVAVDVAPDGKNELHILDALNGQVQKVLPNREGWFITYPKFCNNGKQVIAAVRNSEGGMALALIDAADVGYDLLLPFANRVIAYPFVKGDSVLFTAANKGRDELFILRLSGKKLYKVLSSYTGNYQAALNDNGDKMIWSRFTAGGRQLHQSALPAMTEMPLNEWQTGLQDLYVLQALQQEGGNQLDKIPSASYVIKKYHKGTGLFNFHSWRPYYDQPDWSFTIYGENVLNTFQSELFFKYNENEQSKEVGFNGIFGSLYPWITGGVSYTFDRFYRDTAQSITWNEANANIGLQLPLNFTKGKFYKYLTLASTVNTERLYFTGNSKDQYINRQVNYIESILRWSMQVQQARQHIYPRFAWVLYLQHRGSVSKFTAQQFLATTSLYFPGLLKDHNLVFTGAWQARDTAGQYRFDNNFPFSRGYPAVDFPRMWKLGTNYHFPLLYPDWGFANIVYFLRIRANAFYDYTGIKSRRTGQKIYLNTVGGEIFFDTRWWNQQPVTFGIRYSRLLDTDVYTRPPNPNQWEFILPVNLLR